MLDSHGIVVLNEKVWLVETQRPAKRTRAIGPMDLKPLGNPSLRVADSLETCHEPGPLLCLDVDIIQRVQNSFCFFLAQVLDFFWLSFLVPFALYLQQFGTRICHFAWYLLHFGMVTLHFACYLLHLAMFAFHFAWYLPRFDTSTSHLHGICYILLLQTFMWDS